MIKKTGIKVAGSIQRCAAFFLPTLSWRPIVIITEAQRIKSSILVLDKDFIFRFFYKLFKSSRFSINKNKTIHPISNNSHLSATSN